MQKWHLVHFDKRNELNWTNYNVFYCSSLVVRPRNVAVLSCKRWLIRCDSFLLHAPLNNFYRNRPWTLYPHFSYCSYGKWKSMEAADVTVVLCVTLCTTLTLVLLTGTVDDWEWQEKEVGCTDLCRRRFSRPECRWRLQIRGRCPPLPCPSVRSPLSTAGRCRAP